MKPTLIALPLSMLALLASCKKSTEEVRLECSGAIAKGVDATIGKRKQAIADSRKAAGMEPPADQQAMDDISAKLKTTLTTLCVEDKWATEVLTCFNTELDIARCKDQLTPEQRVRYAKEASKVMRPMQLPPGVTGGMGRLNPAMMKRGSGVGSGSGSAATP